MKIPNMLKFFLLGSLFVTALHSAVAVERVTYIHTDHLGSPMAATDSNGSVVWKEHYEPFGERLLMQDEGTHDLWYTGKGHDPDLKMSYFGARWYDPVVGRFMGVDPAGVEPDNLHSFNRYGYGNNNPYRFVDPDGEWAEDIVLGVPSLVLGAYSFSQNMSQGNYGWAAVDALGMVADGLAILTPGVPGGAGMAITGGRTGGKVVAKGAGKKADDVIQVTKDGVALPAKLKYKIPENYIQNPHRSGSYGEVVNGKFKERLRIDPPTQPGKKGPDYSHYHKNGKGTHYSPRPGNPDPGF